MRINTNQANTNRINNVLASQRNVLPSISLHGYSSTSDSTVFRVTASNSRAKGYLTAENYCDLIAKELNGQFSVVADSIMAVQEVPEVMVISALMVPNTKSIPADEVNVDNRKRFRCVTANVFMNKEDSSIWRLVGDKENRRLVQAMREDTKGIINEKLSRRNGGVVTAAVKDVINYVGPQIERGDYVLYYSVNAGDLAWGFAAPFNGGLRIASDVNASKETVSPLQVIEALPFKCLNTSLRDQVTAAYAGSTMLDPTEGFSQGMADDYLAYMTKLFNGTPYLTALREQIRKHMSLGNMGRSISMMRA